ncbi:hypothetical protein [Nocardioides mesophilus]|uniref:Uncharacterized protein n=1 Tax=Nocardioides mesophilus TaxID=433659 RepID=A0A7G9RG79_9ACTN|nr:hypothetical protein [Nocardioides mesophilus]QNN54604.1 hypothetical protein H9L09_10025 [Nocardioides mesophilus]
MDLDPFDFDLAELPFDAERLDEADLTIELVLRASAAAGPLTQAEIDEILGIAPRSEEPDSS